jgi:hypothetical protein
MKKIFFILIGIISAGFAIYFFACGSVELFRLKAPGSGSKGSAVKRTTYEPAAGELPATKSIQ